MIQAVCRAQTRRETKLAILAFNLSLLDKSEERRTCLSKGVETEV